MADAVTTQTLYEGSKTLVQKFTNVSDGTGESAVKKVDVSALTPAASLVTIDRIVYWGYGMSVSLLWDATTDVTIVTLGDAGTAMSFVDVDFGDHPLKNTLATGYTGDIMFTTSGHTSGDTYNIILYMTKTLA